MQIPDIQGKQQYFKGLCHIGCFGTAYGNRLWKIWIRVEALRPSPSRENNLFWWSGRRLSCSAGKDSPESPWKNGLQVWITGNLGLQGTITSGIWTSSLCQCANLETTANMNNCALWWGRATCVHSEGQFNKEVFKTGLLTVSYFWVYLVTQKTFSAKYAWKYTSTWGNKI